MLHLECQDDELTDPQKRALGLDLPALDGGFLPSMSTATTISLNSTQSSSVVPDDNSDDEILVVKEIKSKKSTSTAPVKSSVQQATVVSNKGQNKRLHPPQWFNKAIPSNSPVLNNTLPVSNVVQIDNAYATVRLDGQLFNGPIAHTGSGGRPVFGIIVQSQSMTSPVSNSSAIYTNAARIPPPPVVRGPIRMIRESPLVIRGPPPLTRNVSPRMSAGFTSTGNHMSTAPMLAYKGSRPAAVASIHSTRPLNLSQITGSSQSDTHYGLKQPPFHANASFASRNLSPTMSTAERIQDILANVKKTNPNPLSTHPPKVNTPICATEINGRHRLQNSSLKTITPGILKRSTPQLKTSRNYGDKNSGPKILVPKPKLTSFPSANVSRNPQTNKHQDPSQFYLRSGGSSGWDSVSNREEFYGRFKCHQCEELLPNNISMINHAYAHFLRVPVSVHGGTEEGVLNEEDDEDVEDFSRCNKCLTVCSSPFNLSEHKRKVHEMETAELVCYICSKEFHSLTSLLQHMSGKHAGPTLSKPGDAPYYCKICKFRSSLFEDLKTHFADEHTGCIALQCPVCLELFDCHAPTARHKRYEIASTKTFINHINAHLDGKYSCDSCQLRFVKSKDHEKHKKYAHTVSNRGLEQIKCLSVLSYSYPNPFRIPIPLRATNKNVKHGRRLIRSHEKQLTLHSAQCIECKTQMNTSFHFNQNMKKCSMCAFTTNCTMARNHHILSHTKKQNVQVFIKKEVVMFQTAYCSCGFFTRFGNKLAHHLVECPESSGIANLQPPPELSCSGSSAPANTAQLRHLARLLKLSPTDKNVDNDEDKSDFEEQEEIMVKSRMHDLAEAANNRQVPTPPIAMRQPSMLMLSRLGRRTNKMSSNRSPSKRHHSESEDDSDDDSSGANSRDGDHRESLAKKAKLEDVFVTRRSTADEAGKNYKMYREKAGIAGQYANTIHKKISNLHSRQLCTDSSLRDCLTLAAVSNVLQHILDQVVPKVNKVTTRAQCVKIQEEAVDFESFLVLDEDEDEDDTAIESSGNIFDNLIDV